MAHEHLNIDKDGFDAVYMQIEATLFYLGAPACPRTTSRVARGTR